MRARTLILALSATMADMRPMAETVSNPSYVPRNYTLSPGSFGKYESPGVVEIGSTVG